MLLRIRERERIYLRIVPRFLIDATSVCYFHRAALKKKKCCVLWKIFGKYSYPIRKKIDTRVFIDREVSSCRCSAVANKYDKIFLIYERREYNAGADVTSIRV